MIYSCQDLQQYSRVEFKHWLNNALTSFYIDKKGIRSFYPIETLIQSGDIGLALYSFYLDLNQPQKIEFQKAVSDVIDLYEISNTAKPVYMDLFDLVEQGEMHYCLMSVALKLGNTVLSNLSADEFEDTEDNIFYFGLTAITSMAGTSIESQQFVTDALLLLVDSPSFNKSYKEYTAKVLFALCVNKREDSVQYFDKLYIQLLSQFHSRGEFIDEDDMYFSDYIREIYLVIGGEQIRLISERFSELCISETTIQNEAIVKNMTVETPIPVKNAWYSKAKKTFSELLTSLSIQDTNALNDLENFQELQKQTTEMAEYAYTSGYAQSLGEEL